MKVALDIDGTVSENPEFFAILSTALRAAGHSVLILTFREPTSVQKIYEELARWHIHYDDLVIAPSLESKGALCSLHGVDLFFDDQDECIAGVPESVMVFKIRNGGNFDFAASKWLSTSKLTKLIR